MDHVDEEYRQSENIGRHAYSKHPEENVCAEVTILTFTDPFKALRNYNFTNAREIVRTVADR